MKIPNAVTLKVLVESYYAGFPVGEINTDSLDSAVVFLKENMLIVCEPGGKGMGQSKGQLNTTEKGDFFVEQLLQMSLPEARQVWVIPT